MDLRKLDFFKKVDSDVKTGTRPGGAFSLCATIFMLGLFVLELNSYLRVSMKSRVVMDEGSEELMQLNFNITLLSMPCDRTSLDVYDALYSSQINVTSNIVRTRVSASGRQLETVSPESHKLQPDGPLPPLKKAAHVHKDGEELTQELDVATFEKVVKETELTLVNYYAPWCVWCQRLHPTWEHTAGLLAEKDYSDSVRLTKIDCTKKEKAPLCKAAHIRGYPTILAYHKGHAAHSHEMYMGDRTPEAFISFVEKQLEKSKARQSAKDVADHPDTPHAARVASQLLLHHLKPTGPEGCNLYGYLLVKKVPGHVIMRVRDQGMSLIKHSLNVSHVVHHLSFGPKLTPWDMLSLPKQVVSHISRLSGQQFSAYASNSSFEHYLKVVSTTFRPINNQRVVHTYKYTSTSQGYNEEHLIPQLRLVYDFSPMSMELWEERQPFYHFITMLCAIIGGVFTVIGLVDSTVFFGMSALQKKQAVGKLG